MTKNEIYLFLLASEREFHTLCKSIVHDGRDPFWVAEGMMERMAEYVTEMQELWEERKDG